MDATTDPLPSSAQSGGGGGKTRLIDHQSAGSRDDGIAVGGSVGIDSDYVLVEVHNIACHTGDDGVPVLSSWTDTSLPTPVRAEKSLRGMPVMGHTPRTADPRDGHASDQAIVVVQGWCRHPKPDGQILGKTLRGGQALQGSRPGSGDDTNPASQPQAGHHKTYRRFNVWHRFTLFSARKRPHQLVWASLV